MVEQLKKLRGVAGLTAFGGLAGALYGVLMIVISSLFFGYGSISLDLLASGALPWAFIGGVSAGGVGLTIATVESQKSLSELSASRAALYGAVLGAAAILAALVLLTPGLPVGQLIVGAGFAAPLGGGVGAGLVAAAKRADRDALPEPRGLGVVPVDDESST